MNSILNVLRTYLKAVAFAFAFTFAFGQCNAMYLKLHVISENEEN